MKNKSRYVRKYVRQLATSFMIAIFIWIIVFNVYALHSKLDSFLKDSPSIMVPEKPLAKYEIASNKLFQAVLQDFQKSSSRESPNQIALSQFSAKIQPHNFSVNCEAIIEWNEDEVKRAQLTFDSNKWPAQLDDSNYIFDKSMCEHFKQLRGYNSHNIDQSEYEFPIAFIILTYYNVQQFERLLRLIYRPQNLYCIHIDANSAKVVHDAIKSIVQCFDNVFIASKLEPIVYAGFSRLNADITCMRDLLASNFSYSYQNRNDKWKYVLNVASTEFPLRTNFELTRILRLYNGANDIEIMHSYHRERVEFKWDVRLGADNKRLSLVRTHTKKSPAPFNFTIAKGITYGAFSRDFVNYTLNGVYAQELLKWSVDTYSPDEWYWATLQHNTQFNPPGGYRDPFGRNVPTKTRYIGWKGSYKCMGQLRHNICIFSYEDLPELVTRNEFFANKFLLEYNPIPYQCMEEWLDRRIAARESVRVINYCRMRFLVPYVKHKRCARLKT